MKPKFFATAAEFRRWLEKHHESADELLVGFYKTNSGRPSMTWPESVDQALCFGWIDGVRKGIDDASYTIRFTPRRPRSNWSTINTRRVAELTEAGLMHPAGLRAFEQREAKRSGIYSYESRPKELRADYEATFRENEAAWRYFTNEAPSYRRTAIFWVMAAKREETRLRRLATLIRDSEQGQRIALLDVSKRTRSK
jgi:uncharacterized protein YdeI (YjbR/CyaY-like superfamily)